MIVAIWRLDAVCDKTRPFKEEPVTNVTAFFVKRTPSNVRRDLARDLPEDVLCKCAALQDHLMLRILDRVPRHLKHEDVGGCAVEVDVTLEFDVRRGEDVDAGLQCYDVEEAAAEIFLAPSLLERPSTSLYVASVSLTAVVKALATEPRFGAKALPTKLSSFLICVESNNSPSESKVKLTPVDGRDGDVTCDGGGRHLWIYRSWRGSRS
jgi:hypothetical protein